MNDILIPYLIYLPSLLLPVGTGIYGYRLLKFEMKLFLALFILALAVELVTFYMVIHGHNNVWVHSLYLPFEYALICLIFSRWQNGTIVKYAMLYSVPIFIVIEVLGLLFFPDIASLNLFAISLSCILYAVISSYTLIQLQFTDYGRLYRDHRFWMSSALLIYSTGCLSFYVFISIFPELPIYYIFLGVNAVSYILYMVGFLCNIRH